MEYAIIEAKTTTKIIEEVAEWMKLGWIPQGGLAVRDGGGAGCVFYQAMIRNR